MSKPPFTRRIAAAWRTFVAPLRAAWRAYSAAAVNRLTGPLGSVTSSDANTEIGAGQTITRNRWRELIRNNPHARRGQAVRVSAIVGSGHVPRPACLLPRTSLTDPPKPDVEANALAMDAYVRWGEDADAESDLGIAGLQTLIVNAWQEGGECLIRRRWRRTTDGLAVPMQLQVLEGDFLDESHDGETSKWGGATVQGVAFDKRGQRRGYWIHSQHPGGTWRPGVSSTSTLIKASEIIHLYTAERAGQVRGMPCGTAVATSLEMLGRIEEAAAVKLRMESCVAMTVAYESVEDANLAGWSSRLKADGTFQATAKLSPGAVIPTPLGKSIGTVQPTATSNADALMLRQLQSIAVGLGITYQQLTGDLNKVNFTSYKAGHVEFERQFRALQTQVFQQICMRRIWQWFVQAASLAGLLPARFGGYPATWHAPRFESVDRKTDAISDEIQMRTGGSSFGDIAASKGRDPDELMHDIARWKDLAEELGISLTWMGKPAPDAVSASSAGSTPAGTPDADDEDDDEEA